MVYDKVVKELTHKAICDEKIEFGSEIAFYSGLEDFRPLLDQLGDVGFVKVVRFQEL
jgi:hypothetical protein